MNIIKEFVGLDRQKAVRKALDYWYKHFSGRVSLKEFMSKCSWRNGKGEVIVTYKGPSPQDK